MEIFEGILELLNLILALIGVIWSVQIYKLLQDKLKKVWFIFLIVISLFAIHEIVGTIYEFNLISMDLEWLYTFTEFIFVIASIYLIYSFKVIFLEISKNKKGNK